AGSRGHPPPVVAAAAHIDDRRDDLPDVHRQERRHGRDASRSRTAARSGVPGQLSGATKRRRRPAMTEPIGLPPPPAVGETALAAGTFDGETVFVTGGGTGLGKAIASEFARLGASIVIASRKEDHLDAGREAIDAIAPGMVETVTCDIRDVDTITAAFDAAERPSPLPSVLVNNAAA